MIWLFRVGLDKPVTFFPEPDPNFIYVNMDMPEGADLEYSDRIARQVEIALCKGAEYGLAAPSDQPADCYQEESDAKNHTLLTGRKVKGITDMANVKYIYSRAVAAVPVARAESGASTSCSSRSSA